MTALKPFFCYYGGKWRAAPRYPTPRHDTIVEPFAGAAGYATRYADRRVLLIERDPIIAALWGYLIHVSADEIRRLPVEVDSTDDLNVCAEAKSLIGFWLNKGTTIPKKTPSLWARSGKGVFWGPRIRERIACQVEAIRHWQVVEGSYETAPDMMATWFIDPPYQVAGKCYHFRLNDYSCLAEWCKTRKGQVMVCENEGATWLPFESFAKIQSTPGARGKGTSNEALWTNGEQDLALYGFPDPEE